MVTVATKKVTTQTFGKSHLCQHQIWPGLPGRSWKTETLHTCSLLARQRTGGQDGVKDIGAKVAEVGDGEGAGLELVGRQLLGSRALHEVGPVAADLVDVRRVRVLDHGRDQAAVRHGHRQRHIDVLVVGDAVAVRCARCTHTIALSERVDSLFTVVGLLVQD